MAYLLYHGLSAAVRRTGESFIRMAPGVARRWVPVAGAAHNELVAGRGSFGGAVLAVQQGVLVSQLADRWPCLAVRPAVGEPLRS